MSDKHQLKQRLGWSLAAIALMAAPSFGSATQATASAKTSAVVAATAAAPSATKATQEKGRRGSHRYRHRAYHRGYGHFGYYGGRYYPHYGFPYYGYGHRYGYGRYPYRNLRFRASQVEQLGALDFDVKPKSAEVFLDGRSIGTVGQFDGFPDYLWLEKGTYDVTVYLDGHQSIERTYRVYPGLVIDVDGRMAPGNSVRPEEPVAEPPTTQSPPPGRLVQPEPSDGTKGRLLVSVTPVDAAVYLDGHFLGVAQELEHVSAGLLVEAGRHTIEVARPGYRGVTREVEISADDRFELSVTLTER